jgi:hypothetical protein
MLVLYTLTLVQVRATYRQGLAIVTVFKLIDARSRVDGRLRQRLHP